MVWSQTDLVEKQGIFGELHMATQNRINLFSMGLKRAKLAGVDIVRMFDGWFLDPWLKWRTKLSITRQQLMYQSRPTDIFIVSYPKSGTTWMQMIVYQLLTDGNMNIPHISSFIPHLEAGVSPERLAARPDPRILKSHLPYRQIPKGNGKYIYLLRNGLDVAVSYYFHHRRYLIYRDSFEAFFGRFLSGAVASASWFDHVHDWLKNEQKLDLLVMPFEELASDFESSVVRVAEFCGVSLNDATRERILDNCSFEFMRKHEDKLDVSRASYEAHIDDSIRFMRKGQVGDSINYVSAAMRQEYLSKLWKSLSTGTLHTWPGLDPQHLPGVECR